jgi:hypothetical protein
MCLAAAAAHIGLLANMRVLYHIFVKKQGITAKNALFQINIMLVWGKWESDNIIGRTRR